MFFPCPFPFRGALRSPLPVPARGIMSTWVGAATNVNQVCTSEPPVTALKSG